MFGIAWMTQDPVPVKPKHIRRLLVETWKLGEEGAAAVYALRSMRPITTSAVVALKCITLVLKMMQQGSPKSLPASYNAARLMR